STDVLNGEVTDATPLLEIDEQQIVPFTLEIFRDEVEDGTDIARQQGICFYAPGADGVYLAHATGLLPGDYIIRAALHVNDPPLDFERYEYAPALINNARNGDYTLSARLRVEANPLVT